MDARKICRRNRRKRRQTRIFVFNKICFRFQVQVYNRTEPNHWDWGNIQPNGLKQTLVRFESVSVRLVWFDSVRVFCPPLFQTIEKEKKNTMETKTDSLHLCYDFTPTTIVDYNSLNIQLYGEETLKLHLRTLCISPTELTCRLRHPPQIRNGYPPL